MRASAWSLLTLMLTLSACHHAVAPTAAQRGGAPAARALPGEALIRLAPGTNAAAYARRHKLELVQAIGLDIYRVKGKLEVARLSEDAAVRWAEPNYAVSLPPMRTRPAPRPAAATGAGPNDPLLPAQYYRSLTGADRVWPVQPGSREVVVAVIDSGIDATHPEFAGQLVPGWDVTVNPPVPGGTHDGYGHGTHVAGVIGAIAGNGLGIAGLAPGCKLMPVRIFNDSGHSSTGASAAAVIWAVEHGAKVINASWGSPMPGQAAEDAYRYALEKDVVFVSAVGNSGSSDTRYYPGATAGVLGVAATTDIDTWGSFSTYGEWVSLAAPGKGILSTYPLAKGNGYRIMDGTSMASPVVAAAAALVRSQYPQLGQAEVKARLEATAKDVIKQGIDPYSGHGRVDIGRAVLDAR